MKTIEVVAAIIKVDSKFLCLQRGEHNYDYVAFKYEFPCGKIEIGESRPQALIREIKEELDYAIWVDCEFITVEHQYPDFQLLMHSYLCTAKDINFTLIEHIDYKWLTSNQLERLDWAAADRAIVKQLVS
ncbi:DNA mismatch repair protein MutT [Candidatus Poribacteria bacterium]|nr:DNA mismatch repair protein MutT [Candidatus Poribacteria bacterium]